MHPHWGNIIFFAGVRGLALNLSGSWTANNRLQTSPLLEVSFVCRVVNS